MFKSSTNYNSLYFPGGAKVLPAFFSSNDSSYYYSKVESV